jgi:excisionase family DNA binding protein
MNEDQVRLDYRDPEWVAEQLGIDKNTVYKYLQEGTLPGLQIGRKWLVSERRLASFLERVEREQTQRRREAAGGASRPFTLPQRLRGFEEEDGAGDGASVGGTLDAGVERKQS